MSVEAEVLLAEERQVQARRFRLALAALPAEQRAAVILRHQWLIREDDYRFVALPPLRIAPECLVPWDVVAGHLGCSVEAVRQQGARGLRAVRQHWAALGASADIP
jgi:DNA-directed RNA polymerase specialized sigma24 family protein